MNRQGLSVYITSVLYNANCKALVLYLSMFFSSFWEIQWSLSRHLAWLHWLENMNILRLLCSKDDISHLHIPSPLDNLLPWQPSIVNANFLPKWWKFKIYNSLPSNQFKPYLRKWYESLTWPLCQDIKQVNIYQWITANITFVKTVKEARTYN